MRIGIDASCLQHALVGGIGRSLGIFLNEWKAAQEHTFLLYTHGFEPDQSLLGSNIVHRPVEWARGWYNWGVPALAVRDRLSVFFAISCLTPLPFLLAKRPPCVVKFHDANPHAHPEWFPPQQRWRQAFYGRLSALRAAHVITPSASSRRDLVKLLGVPPKLVTVVADAAATHFRPLDRLSAQESVYGKYGIRPRFVLQVGAVHPKRNIPRLIRAMHLVREEYGLPHSLVIVGELQWPQEALAEAVADNNAGDWVHHLTKVGEDDLLLLYNAADVAAYVSMSEGFGLPPLEAMACGTPVVASSVSSIPEVTGTAAVLVDPMDERAIASGIADVLRSAELRSSMRSAGLAQSAKFSWSRSASETLSVLVAAGEGRLPT